MKRAAATGQFSTDMRVDAVMAAAERSGLLHEKRDRIGGRVNLELIRQAEAQTGIKTDTDLIEFALANVALKCGAGRRNSRSHFERNHGRSLR